MLIIIYNYWSIYTVQNLVHRDYSKHVHPCTHTGTHTHEYTDHTKRNQLLYLWHLKRNHLLYLRHLKRNWMTMTCVTVHCWLWIVSQQSIHCPLTWSGLAARRWRRGRTCWIGCWGQRSALPGGWPAPPWGSHTMGPQDPRPAAADCQQKLNHLINTLQSSLYNPTLNHLINTLQSSLVLL